jgi:polyisoprenoid-binding protein YceI
MPVRSARRSRALLAAVPAVLLAAGAPTALAQEASPTPAAAMGVLEDAPAGLADCQAPELGGTPAAPYGSVVYQIVPEESAARYRVQEELATVGVTEAVGETRAVLGSIVLGPNGLPVPCSRFDVDLRTLQSDEARRDNYLYENTLETATYPLATFVLRGVEGLDGPLAEGEETTFTLLGDLTVKDTTRLVAWQATAAVQDGALTGSAATEFEMPEFGIEPPSVRIVVSLDETVRLEMDLTARAGT